MSDDELENDLTLNIPLRFSLAETFLIQDNRADNVRTARFELIRRRYIS